MGKITKATFFDGSDYIYMYIYTLMYTFSHSDFCLNLLFTMLCASLKYGRIYP